MHAVGLLLLLIAAAGWLVGVVVLLLRRGAGEPHLWRRRSYTAAFTQITVICAVIAGAGLFLLSLGA